MGWTALHSSLDPIDVASSYSRSARIVRVREEDRVVGLFSLRESLLFRTWVFQLPDVYERNNLFPIIYPFDDGLSWREGDEGSGMKVGY